MARIEGIGPKQTSFPMRYVFKKVRKMLLKTCKRRRSRSSSRCARTGHEEKEKHPRLGW
jgi:hypothetical protein